MQKITGTKITDAYCALNMQKITGTNYRWCIKYTKNNQAQITDANCALNIQKITGTNYRCK